MIKCMTDLKRKEMFMADQKIDNLLNLAMDATPEERRKSENLNIGYDMTSRQWDIIVKIQWSRRVVWLATGFR